MNNAKYYTRILTSKLTTRDLTTDNGRSTPKTCTRQRLPNRVRVELMFAAICNGDNAFSVLLTTKLRTHSAVTVMHNTHNYCIARSITSTKQKSKCAWHCWFDMCKGIWAVAISKGVSKILRLLEGHQLTETNQENGN